MPQAATLILAALGIICIAVGYRLFCGLPALRRQHRTPRAALFVLNILPGALLALFGAGLFTVQARTLLSKHPGIHQHEHATQETGWPHTSAHIPSRSA
jgi:hypothetical protein